MSSLLDVLDAFDTLDGAVSRLEQRLQQRSAEEQAKLDGKRAQCAPGLALIDQAAANIKAAYADKAAPVLQRAEACFAERQQLLNSGAAQRRLERGAELVAVVRGYYANAITVPRRLHEKVEALVPDISPERFAAILRDLEESYDLACGQGTLDHLHRDVEELAALTGWLAEGRGGRGKIITIPSLPEPTRRQRHGTMTAFANWP